MLTTNVRGIEKAIKEKGLNIRISTNKKSVYILSAYSIPKGVTIYTGHSLKNVLIKASKFLPAEMNETQKCVMANNEIRNPLEYALNEAKLVMYIYIRDDEYHIEMYNQNEKVKQAPVFAKQGSVKDGLISVLNALEQEVNEKLQDFKYAHPKEFGIED